MVFAARFSTHTLLFVDIVDGIDIAYGSACPHAVRVLVCSVETQRRGGCRF